MERSFHVPVLSSCDDGTQVGAILVVTHDLELVACACDRALCVEGGTASVH
ncbi:hypothetical protein IV77_GL000043 [Olsenella uli DSM 7084]|nr:hypothetical protein IV77_GL000043 [Olsenella uli DSM 7084]